MKVFIAGFDTETNTFAPIPTGYQNFVDAFLAHGDATSRPTNYCSNQLLIWRRGAEARGWDVAESICTYAEPGGRIVAPAYAKLRDELLDDLRRAMPVDVVLLALHGAMAAQGCDDCEGDILSRVREIVGPKAIVGAELDLHCHITDAMVSNATLLVIYKEYPHVDIGDRAQELFLLAADAAEGRTRPVMAMHDCRMIGTFRTTEQPLRGFVDRMYAMEGRNGILSVSLGHCFPWADVADIGVKTLAVVDGDAAQAERVARALGEEIFAMREALAPKFLTVDAALDAALARPDGPVVIADTADNAGGGAPGDSTFILRRMLERGITNVASGYYWDPVAVRFCQDAGIGATFELRVGGKTGKTSGDPVDLLVTVRGIAENAIQHFGPSPQNIGTAVWVSAHGIDLLLTTVRTQVFHPEGFAAAGLDVSSRKIVVVKSTQHFHAGFAPIAKAILYASGQGAMGRDFAAVPYTKITRPWWPKVQDPLAIPPR
jgi:microcystin degradation protein MlrC